MKKYLPLILTALFCFSQSGMAQDDDVYFIPSKKEKKSAREKDFTSEYTPIDDDSFTYSNWAENRSNNGRDVDEYNRRSSSKEKSETVETENYDAEKSADGDCTARIIRFHSPSVGVYVSSPYYSDYIDVWLDPFFYDPWYHYSWGPYYGWSGWYGSPYYWHSPYWYDPWYDPWGPYYGYGCYYPYYGHHHYYHPVPRGAQFGPHGGYVYYGHRNSGSSSGHRYTGTDRYSSHYNNGRPSRSFDSHYNNGRPSRNYNGNYGRPSRNQGNSSNSRPSRDVRNSNSRPSREIRNNGNSRPSTPSRSFDAPSRSFNSGHSSGGNRNFGGGNHSRGGRR